MLDDFGTAGLPEPLRQSLHALNAYFTHLAGDAGHEETLEILGAAHAALVSLGALRQGLRVGMWTARLQRNDGDLQGARAIRQRLLEQQRQLADRRLEGHLVLEEGFDSTHHRRFEEALVHFGRAAEIFRKAEPIRMRYVQQCRGLVLLELRRHAEARQDLEDAAAWAKRNGRLADEQHDRKILALLHLDQGLAERAARVARRAVALGEELGDRFNLDTARMQLASALQRLGDSDGAIALYDAIDVEALPVAPRAWLLGRRAALARTVDPEALEPLAQELSRLLDHATVPDVDSLRELLDALLSGDPLPAEDLVDRARSVEVRVLARLVLDSLRAG